MSRFSTPIALLLAGLILAPIEAEAQTVTPSDPTVESVSNAGTAENAGTASSQNAPAVLTLKERLGAKWKDEQRVNNCNVPPEKRGSKPRPERCAKASPQ